MADEQTGPPTPPRRRTLRRVAATVGALVVGALAVAYVLLPRIARPAVERALSAALGTRVSIGQLSWAPFAGVIAAERLAAGDGDQATVTRVFIEGRPVALWRGEIVIDRIIVDAPSGAVELDANYRPVLPANGDETTGGSLLPPITIRELVITNGDLTIRHPVRGERRAAQLHVARLVSSGITFAGDALEMRAQITGALDGAPLDLDGHLHLAGAETAIEVAGKLSGLEVTQHTIDLPAGIETFRGTVDVRATYDAQTTPTRQTVRLDVRLHEPRLTGPTGTEVGAKIITLPDLRADLTAKHIDLGAVEVEAPTVSLTVTPTGIALPLSGEGNAEDAAWTIGSGAIEARNGRLQIRRGESRLALTVVSGHWGGIGTGRPESLTLRATADGGGSLAVTGTLGIDPFETALDVELQGVPLPPLTELAAEMPLRLAKGTGDADVRVTHRGGRLRLIGHGRLRDAHTAPPDPSRPAEVMAVHLAEADLAFDSNASPALDLMSLELAYPYVMVQRHADGTFPYNLVNGGGTPAGAAGGAPATGGGMRVRKVAVDGGKVEFMDMTLEPVYWASLSHCTAQASDLVLPGTTQGRFTIAGMQDELSPLDVSGTWTRAGVTGRAELRDVLLRSLNPYLSPLLGYDATAGRLTFDVEAAPAPPLYRATARVVLRGVDVLQTGVDVIQQQSGVPLPIALGLIANASGQIDMTVPLAMDTTSGRLTFGSVVGQAVRSAIVGALTSPLRVLGSLFGTRGAPYAFAIDPIPFADGAGSLAPAGVVRVAEIARILQAHPGLVLVATPQITAADLRAAGEDEALGVADERLEAVRDAFTGADADPRLPPERLMLVAWKPPSGPPPSGPSGVYVELQDQP